MSGVFMSENNVLNKYLPILRKNRLFAKIPEEHYTDALQYLEYTLRRARQGERVLSSGSAFRYAYLLLEGELGLSFVNEAAEKVSLNHFYAGDLLGEAMAVSPKCRSSVDIEAEADSVYLTLNLRVLLSDTPDYDYRNVLLVNLLQALAGQNLFLNQKVRILGQKSVRDRLYLYFLTLPENSRGYRMIPYTRTELAAYLGLNRSAMVREMGKMQRDGLIEIDGERVRMQQ